MDIERLVKEQRSWYQKGKTRSVGWRISALKTLRRGIITHEKEIQEALKKDLGKSVTEGYMCETGMVLSELST